MLVLDRHVGERIFVTYPDGTEVVLTLISFDGFRARVGIEAPRGIPVDRAEIRERKKTEGTVKRAKPVVPES